MSEIVDIWREKVPVRFGNIDRSDRLTLWSIFDFFQEAAISHAANLGVGRDAMTKSGQAWILSRLSLFVERRPQYGEIIEVSTWPRKWEKLFALRDYAIRDSGGKAIVRGRGAWIVFDIEKRRPLRAQLIMEPLPHNDGIDSLVSGPVNLSPREGLEGLSKAAARSASYSDIDFYGHTNNARYIQWIQDATDMDLLSRADQIRLDINYLSEVMPGDNVEIWTGSFMDAGTGDHASAGDFAGDYPASPGHCFAYEGRRDGAVVFRAELIF